MQTNNRQSYLDWLRIMAIAGVLLFHSAMPFVEWEWHIKNKEHSNILTEFNFFLSRFRMPLLFFISGAVAFFMLKNRTAGQFIGLRFRRLFVPLVFGMLLIVPIQVYMERMNQGFKGSFFQFYPSIFTTGAYPKGNLSWHHLWFIAYLFVYDVLLAPLFKWLLRNGKSLTPFNWLAEGKRAYLLIILPALTFTATVLQFPETHDLINDWCWGFYWLFFLLAGFIFMCVPSLTESLERNRRSSLTVAFLLIMTINYFRWNNLEPYETFENYKQMWQTYTYLILYPLTAWFWVFALVGYGKRYLNKGASALNYINTAVYPFYILHQTVIVVLAYYVVKTPDDIFLKYSFIVLATLFISMSIYHLFIRPFAVTRFLFGAKKETVKPVEKQQSKEVIALKPQVVTTIL